MGSSQAITPWQQMACQQRQIWYELYMARKIRKKQIKEKADKTEPQRHRVHREN